MQVPMPGENGGIRHNAVGAASVADLDQRGKTRPRRLALELSCLVSSMALAQRSLVNHLEFIPENLDHLRHESRHRGQNGPLLARP
jgi:hypothetical protein